MQMRFMKWLVYTFSVVIILALAPSFAFAGNLTQPNPTNSLLWVDIRDLAQFSKVQAPWADIVSNDMRSNFAHYFPAQTIKIYGVELNQLPQKLNDDSTELSIQALVRLSSGESLFRKLLVNVGGEPMRVLGIKSAGEDIPLNRVSFSIQVSLVERKFILQDKTFGIKKVYPIGVGALDMGVSPASGGRVRLATPLFDGASINQANAMKARTDPAYYKGMPFMPIKTARGTVTNVAFHIEVNNSFVRGFDSHGCMRMREKDDQELYQILMNGASNAIPVEIAYRIDDLSDHPAPKINDSYQRIKNFGTATHPIERRDAHNLVILERVSGEAPVDQLR